MLSAQLQPSRPGSQHTTEVSCKQRYACKRLCSQHRGRSSTNPPALGSNTEFLAGETRLVPSSRGLQEEVQHKTSRAQQSVSGHASDLVSNPGGFYSRGAAPRRPAELPAKHLSAPLPFSNLSPGSYATTALASCPGPGDSEARGAGTLNRTGSHR